MENTFKRLLSLLAVVVLVFSLIPANAVVALATTEDGAEGVVGQTDVTYVAEVSGGAQYATVAEAIAAANAGDTVALLANIDKLPVIDKAITIDGNGCSVAGSAGENQFGSINGTVTIKNVKFDNGNEAIRTDYLSADYSNLDLVIKNCYFENLTTYAIMGGKSDPDNHLLKSLTIEGCEFTASAANTNYMVYAQCVGTLNVTGCKFEGKDVTKGAIHTGDSTAKATVATISGNTISGVARGVQIGNRVEGSSVAVSGNTFTNVTTAADSKSGAIYVHGNADENVAVSVTDNGVSNCTNALYNDGNVITDIVTTFTGNMVNGEEVVLDAEGNVTEKPEDSGTSTAAGTISGCLVDLSDPAETFIVSEITGLNATESVVIKLYSGETQIATTTLKKTEYFQTSPLGVKIIITGESSSWETVWAEGMPRADMVPDKVVLYVDGVEMNSANVPMTSTNGELAVNWAEVPGVNPAPSAPTGTITPVYTRANGFWGEGGGNANESLAIELYEGEKLIATSTLNNIGGIIDGDVYVTWAIPFAGSTDEYWTVEWAEGYPKHDMAPTTGVMVIDGEAVAESAVQFNAPDNLNKIVALAEGFTGGVVAYTSLADAMGSFNGRKVNVLRDVAEAIEEFSGVTLTTNVEGGVTITNTLDDYIYTMDSTIGEGVTVVTSAIFFQGGENNVVGRLEVDNDQFNSGAIYYQGYDAVVNVKDGGSVDVEGSVIFRYNENEGALNIYGDNDDSTVEFACDYYIGAYSGTFYAEDANIVTGYFLLKNSYDDSSYANVAMTLNNSSLTVVGTTDGQDSFIIDDQASLTLENGASIEDVRDFSILAGANLALSIDETSAISAANVSIAEDVPLSAEIGEDGTVTFTKTLLGTGTEADPILISSLEDLKMFRDEVNSGNAYKGKYVKLTADIDLANEDWTPIGTSSNRFQGSFDGGNHTISNLYINDGLNYNDGGEHYVGLFGYINNGGYLKNLTIENANVTGCLYVGALVGRVYIGGVIENCHVKGNIAIEGYWYVGGIAGRYEYATGIYNCSVDGAALTRSTSYIEADTDAATNADQDGSYVGGIVGFMAEGNFDIDSCSVSNITISGETRVGGISGIGHYGNNITNCSVTNVTIQGGEGATTVGTIIGATQGTASQPTTITGSTVTDTTAKAGDVVVTGLYGTTINGTTPVTNYVAEVNGVLYDSLEEAFAVGGEVVLIRDVSAVVSVPENAAVTLNLNGKTLNGSILAPNAELTVKNGSIVNADNSVSALEINAGTLTLENVNIDSARHAVRIDGAVEATINGGTYRGAIGTGTGTYHAVNVSGAANVTIKGGTFVGPKGTTADSGAAVNVQSGAVVTIEGGSFSGGLNNTLASKGTLAVYGGSFDQAVAEDFCGEGYIPTELSEGVYSVKAALECMIGTKFYASLDAALAAAKDGDTILMLANTNVETLDISKDVTINLNGTTLKLASGNNNIFGDVTITNGTVDITGVTASGDCIIGIGDYSNNGKLTLDGVNVTGNGYSSAYAVFYVYNTSELNINDSNITLSNDSAAAGGFIKAEQGKDGIVNITDSTISLTDAQIGFLDGTVKIEGTELTINGGANAINQSALTVIDSTITIDGADGRALTLSQGDVTIQNSTLNLSNCAEGEIRFKQGLTLSVDENSTITECSIYADASAVGTANVNGTLVTGIEGNESTIVNAAVTNPAWAANVNGTSYYMTIAEALSAAQAGDTVTILAGEYTGDVSVNKAITVVGEGEVNITGKLSITADGATVKGLNFNNGSGNAGYISAKNVLVEDCTVVGGNGFRYCYTSGTVTFKDSTITGSTYGIHFDGNSGGEIVIDNCVITGWTSFASTITKVTMTDTTFAEGNYNYIRFYQDAVITGCTFNEKMAVDIADSVSADVVVSNCTVENGSVEDLFDMNDINNSNITVDGETLGLVISTEEDLQELAALVNDGNSLAGVTVVLANDITLTEAHTPIGTSANPFKGTFDGQNYTISNLVIEQDVESAQRSALFGQANNATIKNVKVNGVKASGLARVAAIVGGATVTTVENCHVTGDISLCGYQYVGAIVGYGYVTVKDCSVAGSADNYADYTVPTGDSYGKMYMGGIVGWMGEGNSSITGCSVKYVNLTTNGNVGAITGLAHYGNTVANCTAEYVNITANSANQRPGTVGLIAGGCAGTATSPATFTGNTASNVVATDGGKTVTVLYGTDPMGEGTDAVTNYVAEVNGTYYESLADAIVQGGTVKLLKNLTVTESVVIPEGVTVTLDLNGKTLQTDASVNDTTAVHTIINNGNLTVIDSVGGGAVVANDCYTAEDGTKTKSGYAINSTGTLVIDGAKIEGTNWGYAVVVSGKTTIEEGSVIQGRGAVYAASGADVTINGGEFKISVLTTNARDHVICLDGGDAVINGGTFDGTVKTLGSGQAGKGSSAVMLMNSASSVVINGGTFAASEADIYGYANGTTAAVNGGSFSTGLITRTGAEIDLYGGTYNYDPTDYCAEGFVPEANDDGTYGVIDDPATHYISNLDELKAFRDDVNAGNTYKGITVYLSADIDLGSEEWTPIGNSTNNFQGTFDGQNHTISNLVITGSNSNVGLFGFTTNGEIKNLTVNNAKVSGRLNVGVVAGTPYTSKYSNITVTGHVEVNGMSYVGGVGGKNAYADWTDITVNVDETSYVKATSTENGTAYRTYVGGVIGFMGEGNHTFKNITSNIDVIGDVCDIGGITGIAHYGNNFINVTCSGDVTNTNANAEDVLETGGIAGVWHNGGSAVTFENLTYTGTVSTPNAAEVILPNGGLIGAAYSASGTGEIDGSVAIIEGKSYATLAEALAAVQAGQTIYLLPCTIDLGGGTEGTLLPVNMINVTIKGAEGHTSVIKNGFLIQNKSNFNLTGVTFDGIVFEDSYIVITSWDGNSICKDFTINNCIFQNLDDANTMAPLHATQAGIQNLTFTNNVVKNLTGGNKSGVYAFVTGNIEVTGNTFDGIQFRPVLLQVYNNDGIEDTVIFTENTISNSSVGRVQILGTGTGGGTAGTDDVTVAINENSFTGITNSQQICVYNFNAEKTEADLSKNYYDIDIVANPSKIYYNSAAQNVEDLINMNVYPYYADEAMTELVYAPAIEVTYADGTVEYFDDILEAVPYTTNYPKLEGATVKLLGDIEGAGIRMMENDMVLDLNGHTYTIIAGTGSQGTNTSGFQIRPEVTTVATIKNGTIKVAEGAPVVWMFNVYAADFVVEDVTVDCTNMAWGYGSSCYVVVSRSGDNVQFTGTTAIENFNSEVAGNAINVGGTMTIGENVIPGGTIELDAGATLTACAGLDVVTVDGYMVTYANGVYSTVKAVAQVSDAEGNVTYYGTIVAAIAAAEAGDTVTILAGEYTGDVSVNKAITVVGETDADGNNLVTINGKLSVTGAGVTVKNLNVNNSSERALYVSGGNILIEGCNLTGVHGLRYCYANNGDVTLKNCVITGSTYGVHFDAGNGEGEVIIDGCTITGWTSFGSAIEGVSITNTEFKDGNYDVLRFYQDATLTNCTFSPATSMDFGKNGVTANINGCSVSDGSAVAGVVYLGDIVNMGVKVYIDGVLLTVEATVTDAEGNTEYYQTLEEAVAAAKDGDTVTLTADVALDESLVLNTEGTITIDGNGHKITQAEGYKDTQNGLIMLGATTNGDAEAATRIYTIENVTFEGINDWSVIRSQGVTLTMDGCTITGCNQTNGQALLRLDYTEATIKNTTISDNNALMAITHNFNGNSSNTKLTVDNCVVENNTFNKTAAIYYVTGSGCEITKSEFVNNDVNCNQNGAVIYLGFQDNCSVTGNLFKDNDVIDASTSKRVAGAIFAGYQATIIGNAFDGNTAANANGDALGQDVCISTYYEEGFIDLTGNYWGGNEPVPGADYFVQHQDGDGEVSVTSYYESYTLDAEGNVVLSGEVKMTAVAQIAGSTVKYTSLQAALDAAAEGATVTLLADVTLTEAVSFENVNIDLNGKTLTLAAKGNGTIGDVTISNGNIVVTDGNAGSGNTFITVGGKWAKDSELTLDGVTLNGENYTTNWAVICVHNGNTLNITDSVVTLTNELGAAGGFIKDTSGNANTAVINIENSELTLTNVKRGFTGGQVNLTGVELTITGGEHGINGSELYVDASELTITDGTGRGITVTTGPVEINNSTVTISNMAEGSIRFKNDEQLAITGTSNVSVETIVVDSEAALEDVVYIASRATLTEMVAKVGDTYYADLASAVAAAEAGETVTVIADVSDVAVTVDKSITITGEATLNNVSITASGTDVELTVSNLTFTGKSWINANNAKALTVTGVTANVTLNRADAVTNSRAGFISLGAREFTHGLLLNITDNNIVVTGDNYPDPIIGWSYIADGSVISGNTFGSETAPNWDAVKLLNVMDGATITMENNTAYVNGNGFAVGQNNSRANDYTLNVTGNDFYGSADYIWIEVTGATTANAIVLFSDNTANGEALTVAAVKTSATSIIYAGSDVETDADGKLTGGTFSAESNKDLIAEGCEAVENADGTWTVKVLPDVAKIGDTYYKSLAAAVAAAEAGETVTLLSNATGSGIVFENGKNVIIDLNGYTYTLNESVGSSAQYGTVGFYLWAGSNVTIKNGTINMVPDEMGDDVTFFKMFHTYGDLTLTDVILDCANGVAYNGSTDAGFIAVESDNGTVTMNGATSIINAELSPETWTVTAYRNGKITIDTTGTIEGNVVSYGSNASVEIKNGNFAETNESYDLLVSISSGSIAVSGGTFTEDVTNFCIEGYEAVLNAETGLYEITEKAEELLDLSGMTMTLSNSLAVNFVMDAALLDGDGHYAEVTFNGKTVKIDQTDWTLYSGTLQQISFTGVYAKQMNDVFSVTIYNAEGEAVTNEYVRSIRGYAEDMIERYVVNPTANAAWLAVFVDMLNYGAAAQAEFGYDTENPANAGIDAYQIYASEDVEVSNTATGGAGYAGASLTLENGIELNIGFLKSVVTQDMKAVVTFTNHYGEAVSETIEGTDFIDFGTAWLVKVDFLVVADCNQDVTVTIYDGETVVTTATDSVASYIARQSNVGELYQLIMKFATSAKVAFAK